MTLRPLDLPAAVGLTLALAVGLASPGPAAAATYLVLQVEDAPGEGFYDPSPVTPAGGNPATSLGEARLAALQFAAGLWAERLDSPVPIRLAVRFEPLGGTASAATLGLGGPTAVYRDFENVPQPATWFSAALADLIAGEDLDGGAAPDLEVVFNLDVDGPVALGAGKFYYGFDGHPPVGDVSFVQVALHEIAHGLGFTSMLDLSTGAKLFGYDDVYMSWVERVGAVPPDLPSMTDGERLDALRSGPDLRWVGPRLAEAAAALTAGADAQGRLELYAPAQITTSTLRHFAAALTPDDVMEPFYAEGAWDLTLARALLADLGWGGPPGCVEPPGPELGIVFIDDALPAGATGWAENDVWLWVGAEPAPFSGTRMHHSALDPGMHQHYFQYATETLTLAAGDVLFVHAYLYPNALPTTLMLQFRTTTDWLRAYWGADSLLWDPRVRIGDLPPAGEWVRLEVPVAALGLEDQAIHGLAFTLNGGTASWDLAGVERANGTVVTWFDDELPPGAQSLADKDGWVWTAANPPVFSGQVAHHSLDRPGMHQHVFQDPQVPVLVGADDTLYVDVFLDSASLPRELMVHWRADGSWEHRAYWGENLLAWGTDGAASRYPMGGLPPAGAWVRLEVPAAAVDVANRWVSGVAFTLYDGKAIWDTAGVLPGSLPSAAATPATTARGDRAAGSAATPRR